MISFVFYNLILFPLYAGMSSW